MRCLIASLVVLLTANASANDYESLGQFERQEVDVVLAAKGLKVAKAPAGKKIGKIIVVNREVFTEADGAFLQWFNVFHRTTREYVIDREVLLRPGMKWDRDLLDESVRRLRNPLWSNMVAILPVESGEKGTVDLLVVTRDLWSIRFNTDFQFQEDTLTTLSMSLAENNFLGLRKLLSLNFGLNQGSFWMGPSYADHNIGGTRMTLTAGGSAIFAREDGEFEGSSSSFALAYPLWSLARKWGGSVTFTHFDSNVRLYEGSGLRTYDAPETPGDDAIEWRYHLQKYEVQGTVAYQFGDNDLKHRLSFGWELFYVKPSLMDDFSGSDVQRASFEANALPRGETSSGPFVSFRSWTPKYRTYRDLKTFELREDYRMGPEFSYSVKRAETAFGSTKDYTALSVGAEYKFAPIEDSYVQLAVGWSARLQDSKTIDQKVGASMWAASPVLWRAFRLIGRVGYSGRFDETANRFFTLGGETGLRGHALGAYTGLHRFRGNLELRTRALAWYFFRFGAVAFYDVGHAADRVEDLRVVHDVGIGARILVPQINPFVIRLDWAFATEGPTAGFPGRFSAGFFQAF